MKRILAVIALMCIIVTSRPVSAAVSQTPPMGWNSYDCLNFSATEAEVKAMADTMALKYSQYGWKYICVDWCWSFPGSSSTGTPSQTFQNGAPTAATRLNMDAYGRLMPDTVRHPSSVGGAGFKPLADYVHSKGLKFGIHLMRGIPRQAVWAGTPILNTSYHARDAADTTTNCTWLNHMFGMNMSSAAAQAYLKSIFALYASWGVDYVKIDDMVNSNVSPRTTFKAYIQGYRAAIDSCGREMVFSTSPGATPIGDSVFFKTYANQWRMADDLWDTWSTVNNMLGLFANWYRNAGPGHYPDADMIPIGYLSERGPNGSPRYSKLTRNQQYLLMTMWCIGRSPLIWGGDLRRNRHAGDTISEDSLMTNPEVLATNQRGINGRPLTNTSTLLTWTSDNPDSSNVKYLAIMNRSNATSNVAVNLGALALGTCTIRNLWTRSDLSGTFTDTLKDTVGAYGAHLYKLTGTQTEIYPQSRTSAQGKSSIRSTMLVCGNKLTLPQNHAGAPVKLEVFTLSGRRIGSLLAKGMDVDLKPLVGNSSEIFLVKFVR